MNMVEYTEFLVKSICKNPDMVKVSSFETEDKGLMLEIIVHEDDKAAVIGRSGHTVSALRTLIQAKNYIDGKPKVKLNIDSF